MTKRELDILQFMRDEDEELVISAGEAMVGLERTSIALAYSLLRCVAIRLDPYSEVGKFERYTITEEGRKILREAGRRVSAPATTAGPAQ